MKKIYIGAALLGIMTLTSCFKKFDPKSYAPALSINGFTSSDEVASTNLVAKWSFEGNLKDSLSNTVGTNFGTTFTDGIKGKGLSTVSKAYVVSNTPEKVQALKSFTIMTWVNAPLNSAGIAGIIDVANASAFWGNLTLFFENGGAADKGVLKIHVNNGGKDAWLGNFNLVSPWDKWIHIAVTYDAATSTFKTIVNGATINTTVSANYGPIVFQNAQKMVFGTVHFQTNPSLTTATGSQSWASYLNGILDEVRVYDKALTETEIGTIQKLEGRGK